jgi:hypothetical protein
LAVEQHGDGILRAANVPGAAPEEMRGHCGATPTKSRPIDILGVGNEKVL